MVDGLAWRSQARTMTVPHDARGARVARQRLADELSPQIPQALLADTVAVVAELLGNAVRHAYPLAGGVMRLSWLVDSPDERAVPDYLIQIGVTDGGSATLPELRDIDPDAVGGRGLAIVSALAKRWGVSPDTDGQCVWAELGCA